MQASVEIHSLDSAAAPGWDGFVETAAEGTFFHLAGWKDVIERSFGHRCYYLYATRSAEITGVLPLVHIKSRLFSNALISNAFCVYGGPICTDGTTAYALDRATEDLGRSLGVDYVEYRMREASKRDWPTNDTLYATFRKEILPDVDANLMAIPRKQRAMVRKGIKAGLVLEMDHTADRFYQIYSESVRNHGTPVYPKRFFSNLNETFADRCTIHTVIKDREALSTVLSFHFREEVLPYYGGGSAKARQAASYDFMYWQILKRACETGLKTFDFGRSKRNTGSFDFKRHWGFEPTPLSYEYRLLGASEMPDINPQNPKYQMAISIWKRLPLAAANTIGPIISRALG